jgi:RNA polymerase sigma-70 factor (ECF subfamily)
MTDADHSNVTRLLKDVGHDADKNTDKESATNELLSVVYQQLRQIAQQRMGNERADHTLQATALVHEVFIKLVGDNDISWESRGHFFSAAAQAMRRILIDHARKNNALKRGGEFKKIPMSVVDLAANTDPQQVIALDEAMDRLEQEDPRAASIVRLRFYAGLDVAETADALGLSERTVMRDWAFARAKLFQELTDNSEPPSDV